MQNSDLWTRKASLYGSQTWPDALWMQNRVISIRPTSLYVSQPSSVFFLMQYSAFWNRISSLYGTQTSSVDLSTHNCELNTRIKRLDWFQPSPVALCMQNSAFWTRLTSPYGSQTWPVFLCMYNSGLNIRITSLYGSQPPSVVFAFKTAWLASESLVSMGPSHHVWFLDAKQRLMDRNNKSLWVPDITCRFVLLKQRDLH